MKIIYSNFSDVKNISSTQSYEMLKLSNFLSQTHGHYTIFYGDDISLKNFKSIAFNEIHKLNDTRIQEIPKQLWSISKFFAILNTNEPFLHIDNDVLLFRNINQELLEKGVIYLHDEFHMDKEVEKFQCFFNIQPKNGTEYINRSYNCGIFGGQNFSIIQEICNEIIEFIIENKNKINNILNSEDSKQFEPFMPAVLVEQVWIFKLLNFYKQKFEPILKGKTLAEVSDAGYVDNISHLQGTKNQCITQETILKMNNILNIN